MNQASRSSLGSGRLSRRRLLSLAGAGAAALAIPGCGRSTTERAGVVLTSRLPLPRPFTVALPVPDVARPVDGGTAYELVQRSADVEIIPGHRTQVWGYDGTFPGPTFDVRSGQPITVAITNELPVPTSTHLHGGVTPPESDGYPTHLIVAEHHANHFNPAGSHMGNNPAAWKLATGRFVHEYPLDQPAAALWYHKATFLPARQQSCARLERCRPGRRGRLTVRLLGGGLES
jgi:spore coat protein A, manganese oxidase